MAAALAIWHQQAVGGCVPCTAQTNGVHEFVMPLPYRYWGDMLGLHVVTNDASQRCIEDRPGAPAPRVCPANGVGSITIEVQATRQPNRIWRRKPPHIRIIEPQRIEVQPVSRSRYCP